MNEITAMLRELMQNYEVAKGAEFLFAAPKESVGICPRCGNTVVEVQKGFLAKTGTVDLPYGRTINGGCRKRNSRPKPLSRHF